MSKIEKLIQKHCPDGVEYKHLWEVTTWDKRFNAVENYKQPQVIKYKYFLASELKPLIVDGGTIKILTTNISNLYTTEDLAEENYSEGEIIAIPWGGNPIVQYFNGKFLTSDNRIAISNDLSYLNTKYLYYCLLDSMDIISTFYRGSGIKHPDMAKVLDFQIPIPPLLIQQEIVAILDKFTALEAELEARSLQYEYYRNQLLSFEDKDIEWKALGNSLKRTKGTKITASQMKEIHTENGEIKIYAGGKTFAMVNSCDISSKDIKRKPSIIVKSRGIIEFEYYDLPFSHKNEFWSYYSDNKKILIKYVYYFLKTKEDYFQQLASKMQMPQISLPDTENFKIPIPSIEEQERIVNILDQFDALVNDIKIGLPAEIKARRAQYEYYRSKLLTFKKAS